MDIFLSLLSGIAWTIVYIQIIRLALKQKFVGMPLFALALNIAWEGIYTYRGFTSTSISPQAFVNLIWFLADAFIVYLYFKYTKNSPIWSLLVFTTSIILQLLFIFEFKSMAVYYSAFLQNLLMSILFIQMYSTHGSLGQSFSIALAKWIGTLAPSILMGLIVYRPFILVVGLLCSIFDLIYIYLIVKKTNLSVEKS